jgi:hypothetical protein
MAKRPGAFNRIPDVVFAAMTLFLRISLSDEGAGILVK